MFLRPPCPDPGGVCILTTAYTPAGMKKSLGQAFSCRTCLKWISERWQNLVVGFAMPFSTDPGGLESAVPVRLLANDRRRLGKPDFLMCSCFFFSLTTLG